MPGIVRSLWGGPVFTSFKKWRTEAFPSLNSHRKGQSLNLSSGSLSPQCNLTTIVSCFSHSCQIGYPGQVVLWQGLAFLHLWDFVQTSPFSRRLHFLSTSRNSAHPPRSLLCSHQVKTNVFIFFISGLFVACMWQSHPVLWWSLCAGVERTEPLEPGRHEFKSQRYGSLTTLRVRFPLR